LEQIIIRITFTSQGSLVTLRNNKFHNFVRIRDFLAFIRKWLRNFIKIFNTKLISLRSLFISIYF
jgi:hypothetical protein